MEHWGKIRAEVCLVFVVRRLDDISKSSLSKIRNHGCRLRGWVSGTVMNSVKIDSIGDTELVVLERKMKL